MPSSNSCLRERAVDEALVEAVIDDRDETNALEGLVHLVRDGCGRGGQVGCMRVDGMREDGDTCRVVVPSETQ